MQETVGNKLRRARQIRQLSLEDAARATKIRETQLAELEGDDYTNFANLAYARGFLVAYGKYLRVDVKPYMEAFSDASTFGLDDYQYLSAKPVGVYRIPYRRRGLARRPKRKQLIGMAVTLAILAVGAFGWLLTVNIRRLGDPTKLAARLEARERAGQDGSVAPEAVVAVPVPAVPTASGVEKPVAAAPAPEGGIIPVSAPANGVPTVAPSADTPAPNAVPAAVPAEAAPPPTQNSIPALATAATVPATRELLTARTTAAQPQTQQVVNRRPRGQ